LRHAHRGLLRSSQTLRDARTLLRDRRNMQNLIAYAEARNA
jgi:hypothetical protein